jgi:hypothetical protein
MEGFDMVFSKLIRKKPTWQEGVWFGKDENSKVLLLWVFLS